MGRKPTLIKTIPSSCAWRIGSNPVLTTKIKVMRCKIIDNRKEGQQRVISKYLFIPKRIGNERRWLEKSTIKQTLYYMFDVTCGATWWEWRDTEWI
jgi:hypothetical protein